MRPHAIAATFILAATACQPDAGPKTDTVPPPTWFADVKPLFESRCINCHDGQGIGPMALTTHEQVKDWSVLVRQAVESRTMPPWHASNTCTTYSNNRALTDAQVDTVLRWIDAGLPEGSPADEPPDAPSSDPGLSRVDLTLTVEGDYTPEPGDDYRCFTLPWTETTTKYVTGYDIRPTNPRVVHHVNIYAVAPGSADVYVRRQNRDATPGFACSGGGVFSGGTDTALLGSWAPGSHGVDFPRGTGIPVEPGSVVILEMHFNAQGDEQPDRSSFVVSLEDQVEKRAIIGAFWDFLNWGGGGMPIPAGESDVTYTFELDPGPFVPLYAPWLTGDRLNLYIVGLHMHYLGTQGYLMIRNDEGRNECLLEIQDWDFAWQSAYALSEPKTVELGKDRVYIECHFDNTEANQPVLGGIKRTPEDVRWGEDSTDEMCIGFVYLTEG